LTYHRLRHTVISSRGRCAVITSRGQRTVITSRGRRAIHPRRCGISSPSSSCHRQFSSSSRYHRFTLVVAPWSVHLRRPAVIIHCHRLSIQRVFILWYAPLSDKFFISVRKTQVC